MDERKEKNTTKYGEFICSCFQWLPLNIQKEQAKRLSEITKKDEQDI